MRPLLPSLTGFWSALGAILSVFYSSWGLIYAGWGQPNRAIWYLNRGIRLNPKSAKLHYQRGSLIIVLGQPERAIRDFSEAIRLDPKLVDAYSSRGLIYTLLGRHEEAQRDVDQAVRLGADRAVLERQIVDTKRGR